MLANKGFRNLGQMKIVPFPKSEIFQKKLFKVLLFGYCTHFWSSGDVTCYFSTTRMLDKKMAWQPICVNPGKPFS